MLCYALFLYRPHVAHHTAAISQLCTSEIAGHLELGAPENFRYLRESGCVTVPGLDDRKDFIEVEEVPCKWDASNGQ